MCTRDIKMIISSCARRRYNVIAWDTIDPSKSTLHNLPIDQLLHVAVTMGTIVLGYG